MQKVLRRTALAEAQVVRRDARRKERLVREQGKTNREQARFARKEEVKDIKAARHARREDWELGPLAPRRDVGLKKNSYGTVSTMRLRGTKLTMEERLRVNPLGGRYPTIVVGDRVVLLEGRDKGKIGKITELDAQRQEVKVEGLNMVDIEIPGWLQNAELSDGRPIRSIEQAVPVTSVKLIYPLPDPETGLTRDVIIAKLVNGNIFHDRYTGRKRWSRIVPGLNVVVPWPKVEPKQHKDYANDTLRMEVETKTFVPTLLKPPMPSTVIDELRNKYSIFRTRHDEEYIEAKIREDEEKEAKKRTAAEMMTPIKERRKEERKMLKAKGRPKLTEQMLARIGEVIARKNALLLPATDAVIIQPAPS